MALALAQATVSLLRGTITAYVQIMTADELKDCIPSPLMSAVIPISRL
jgi:hypothetical protein